MSLLDFPSEKVRFDEIMVVEGIGAASGEPSYTVHGYRDGISLQAFGVWNDLERAFREAYGFAAHHGCSVIKMVVPRFGVGDAA